MSEVRKLTSLDPETNRSERRERVMEALRRGATLSSAAAFAGVDRVTLWRWRKADEKLDQAIRNEMDRITDQVEEATFRKCLDPDPRNNRLRIFWLKCRRPEIYSDEGVRETLRRFYSDPVPLTSKVETTVVEEIDVGVLLTTLLNAGVIQGVARAGQEDSNQ